MPNGPENDHFSFGGVSASSALAVPAATSAAAKTRARMFLYAIMPMPSARDWRRSRCADRHIPVQNGIGDRVRHRPGFLNQAEYRQDDQEIRKIISGQHARGDDIAAFRRF